MADNELFGISEQLDCSDCVNHGGDWDCDHVQCRKGTDTISRQAAVSGISDLLMLELKGERLPTYNEVYRAIYDLPSAGLVAKDICVPVKDCISRQAAIDAIMCEPTDAHYPSWYAERLEQLPSAQQWIPRDSGKFPGESGYYTVTAYDGVTKRVTYAKYQKRLKRWELTGARAYWRVVAWCPLPEPWKGEDNG